MLNIQAGDRVVILFGEGEEWYSTNRVLDITDTEVRCVEGVFSRESGRWISGEAVGVVGIREVTERDLRVDIAAAIYRVLMRDEFDHKVETGAISLSELKLVYRILAGEGYNTECE